MRRIALLSGLVLVGGLLGPSTALAQQDTSDRWIAVVLPDGQTFTEDNAPMDETQAPPVGTQVFISEVLYTTDDGQTRGDAVGRTHIQCTAQAVEFNFVCDAAFVLDSGAQLLVSVDADFGAEGPETLDIAVTGGTGDWFGATGIVTFTDMSTADETVTLYEADLVLAR